MAEERQSGDPLEGTVSARYSNLLNQCRAQTMPKCMADLYASVWGGGSHYVDLGADPDKRKPVIPDMNTDAARLAINVVQILPCSAMGTVVTDGNGAAFIVTNAHFLENNDGFDCRSGAHAFANMAFFSYSNQDVSIKPYKLILDEQSVQFKGANIAIFKIKPENGTNGTPATESSILKDIVLGVKRGGIELINREPAVIEGLMAKNRTITTSIYDDKIDSDRGFKFWFEEDALIGNSDDLLIRNKFVATERSGGSPIAVKDSSGTLRLGCIVVGRKRHQLKSDSDNFCVPASVIAEYLDLPDSNYSFDNLISPKTIPSPTQAELAEEAAAADMVEEAMTAIESGDHETAYELVLGPAHKGNSDAQAALGFLYLFGLGVPQNATEGALWSRRAAEQGNADGQNNLGMAIAIEPFAERDAEAVTWFRKAAEQGSARGQANLASMYARGKGVAQDEAEAIYWYRKAAENGYAEAELVIGMAYYQGQGVPKDTQEAVRWILKAANQGYAEAQFKIGVFHDTGEGVPENDEAAVDWYLKSAEQGFADAQNNLAWMYGDGVQQDDVEAYFWIILSLESSGRYLPDYPLVLSERMTLEQMIEALNKLDALDHLWTSDVVQALLDRERSALPK